MTSLYNSIYQIMVNNNTISNAELIKMFPDSAPKSIRNYASDIRRKFRDNPDEYPQSSINNPDRSISIHLIEPIIYDKITKNPTNQDLKLAVEILKIKIQNKGMHDNLDIDKYILKGKSCQEPIDKESREIHTTSDLCMDNSSSCQGDVDKTGMSIQDDGLLHQDPIDDDLTHKELAKEIEENDD